MNERRTTFIEHLEELRRRILYSIAAVAVSTVAGFFFAKRFLNLIIQRASLSTTYFFAPAEAFVAQIKVAVFLGIVISFPFILYQSWTFIGPGLTKSERRISLSYMASGLVLFAIGILFGYYILIPYGLRFLLSFGSEMIQPLMNIGKYMNFFLWCLLGSGLLFQLPLLLFFLIRLGIVDVETITNHRPEAIVGVLVLCAVITPTGDFFTLLLLSVPLMLLFELSILIARLSTRKKPQN
ncbi:MAG: twin-arginine translocase subunit TatC [candidate division WOR-3 bacterium]|nr:MAG: twin-arginine translocase subunit TatC [candidate division WOR-3 bacterium]